MDAGPGPCVIKVGHGLDPIGTGLTRDRRHVRRKGLSVSDAGDEDRNDGQAGIEFHVAALPKR
jgi:hypothetical protein